MLRSARVVELHCRGHLVQLNHIQLHGLELSGKKGVHDVVLAHNSLLQRLEVVQIFKTSLSREILDMDRIVARMLVQVTGTTSITMVTSTISGMTTADRRVKPESRLTKRESIAAGLRHRS